MNIILKFNKLLQKIRYKILQSRFVSANDFAKRQGVRFGKNCNFRTKLFGSEPYLIEMGDNVRTSTGVQFLTHDGGINVVRKLKLEYKSVDLMGNITIGNNVFIGINTVVMPGTIIEDNVIIGAGSIARGKLKENSVYAGVPVKYICSIDDYIEKNKIKFLYTKHLPLLEKKQIIQDYFYEKNPV